MSTLPDRPFLTARFGPKGGGIDFLGMRQVSLSVFMEELIPGLNNAAGDFGTFCLGAWIPWKFQQLAGPDGTYSSDGYRRFQEMAEVAMAVVTRKDSPVERELGEPWIRIGVRNQPRLPRKLSFKAVGRKRSNSLYAAALYGPSLRSVQLLKGPSALSDRWVESGIPVAETDPDTRAIVDGVERSLAKSPHFARVVRLDPPAVDAPALEDLGYRGLHPCFYRRIGEGVKRAFLRKLFSDDPAGRGESRRLTATLVLATIRQTPVRDVEVLRRVWYTGLLPSGKPLSLAEPALQAHRQRWAVFQSRQIQRTAVELLLRCFELAVAAGCRTVEAVVGHWRDRSPKGLGRVLRGTVGQLVRAEAAAVTRTADTLAASRAWNARVHGGHEHYDDPDETEIDSELLRSLRMLTRWWLRTHAWIEDRVVPAWVEEGHGERRLAMGWFHRWVRGRLDRPVDELLRDAFSGLVFAQHVKVALMRFDGKVQRLRFALGDGGIVPCREAAEDLGVAPRRMLDRLESFTHLLTDTGVLLRHTNGRYVAGPLADAAKHRGGSPSVRVSGVGPAV